MITNCELPLCMINESNQLNDFDLVLFHLLTSNATYRQWAYDQRRVHPDRIMILDNSAYEFFIKGETLNIDAYIEYIYDLQPDYFILPDVLQDREKTMNSVNEFLIKYSFDQVEFKYAIPKAMGVIQGDSDEELIKCMSDYKQLGIDNICIPFHLPMFKDHEYHDDVTIRFQDWYENHDSNFAMSFDMDYAIGRVQFVQKYRKELSNFNYVHFLGSHCPFEKIYYADYNSMDTGYPVKLGIEGIELFHEQVKPNIIIDDFFEKKLSEETKNMIRKNILTFKKLK